MAGESSAYDLDGFNGVPINFGHVLVPDSIGPVAGENLTAERFFLDLPDGVSHAGTLEAQLEATDAGEQGADPHDSSSQPSAIVVIR